MTRRNRHSAQAARSRSHIRRINAERQREVARNAQIYEQKFDIIMAALPLEVALTEKATRRVTAKTLVLGFEYEPRAFWQDVWIFRTEKDGIEFACNQARHGPNEYMYQLGPSRPKHPDMFDLQTGDPKYLIHIERLYEIAVAKKQHMNAQLIFMWLMSIHRRHQHPLCETRLLGVIQSYSC